MCKITLLLACLGCKSFGCYQNPSKKTPESTSYSLDGISESRGFVRWPRGEVSAHSPMRALAMQLLASRTAPALIKGLRNGHLRFFRRVRTKRDVQLQLSAVEKKYSDVFMDSLYNEGHVREKTQKKIGFTANAKFLFSSTSVFPKEGRPIMPAWNDEMSGGLAKLAQTARGLGKGEKVIHFIRHGEGLHNVAEHNWRAGVWKVAKWQAGLGKHMMGPELLRKVTVDKDGKMTLDPALVPQDMKLKGFTQNEDGTLITIPNDGRTWEQHDGQSMPVTMATDPNLELKDANLNTKGINDVSRLEALIKELHQEAPFDYVIASPMRRATQTAILALGGKQVSEGAAAARRVPGSAQEVAFGVVEEAKGTVLHDLLVNKQMKIIANDNAHEISGLYTSDWRLTRSDLQPRYGKFMDYSGIKEEDPTWDPKNRETHEQLAERAAQLMEDVMKLPDDVKHIVIAGHSAIFLMLVNAVLDWTDGSGQLVNSKAVAETLPGTRWFMTAEMRSVKVTFETKSSM